MTRSKNTHRGPLFCLWLVGALVLLPLTDPASADDIIDAWSSVHLPPPPLLERVTVDSAHAALLILDMSAANCTDARRPDCVRSIEPIGHLLTGARAHHMLVVYSAGPPSSTTPTQTPAALTPRPDEPLVRAGPDKFVDSDLGQILVTHAIHSVIIVGTSAEAAVLYTASTAAMRGLTVIVPVDCFSSDNSNRFPELYTAWQLKNASRLISAKVRLTRASLISFQ